MRISVVIPCYNAARWLGDSLRSVVHQTRPADEILLVDDGSSDGSAQLVAESGLPVKVLQSNRLGGAGARNVGVEAAAGDWIAFQDADDIWLPDHLERAERSLTGGDVAFLGYRHTFTVGEPHKWLVSQPPWADEGTQTGLSSERYLELHREGRFFAMASTLVRRDRLRDVGAFDPSFVRRHDIDMWLRVIADKTWCYDPKPAYAYRADTPGAISRNNTNAEMYYFRALLKNSSAYPKAMIDPLLKNAARTAMAAALTEGDASDVRQAKQATTEFLSQRDNVMIRAALFWPNAFRYLNRHRRARNAKLKQQDTKQEFVDGRHVWPWLGEPLDSVAGVK